MPLYSVFIDLIKAFDTVNGEALWTILERTGSPPPQKTIIKMIQLFYTGMKGQVLVGGGRGSVTEEFVITDKVNQGCVLAPVIFRIVFIAMLSHLRRNLLP